MTPPLELVVTDGPSDENAYKFGSSNLKFEIRFMKQSWIVWESAELVCEKLRRSAESINELFASPFSSSLYLINVTRF